MTYKRCMDCGSVRANGMTCEECGSPNSFSMQRREASVRRFPTVQRAKPLFDSRNPQSIFKPVSSASQKENA